MKSDEEHPSTRGELVIGNLDTLRVFADPLRMRLIEYLVAHDAVGASVKELAAHLGTAATKLYYHVNLLEEHGIVRVASTRVVSGIIEKRYAPTARRFRLDRRLLDPASGEAEEVVHGVVSAVLDSTREELETSLLTGTARLEDDAPPGEHVLLFKGLGRMGPERAEALRRRLEEVEQEFATDETDSTPPSDAVEFGLLVCLYPMPRTAPATGAAPPGE